MSRRLLQEQENWKAVAREKIDAGWRQAKSGQLLTPEQIREDLAARNADWKQRRGK
jgi:predicted transcriptional regulator